MAENRTNKSKSSCCVPECTTAGYVIEDAKKVSFHRLPKDKTLLKTWIIKIRRDPGPNFQVSDHTKVCSRHFKAEDFYITDKGRRFLKPNTVPSVFSWSSEEKSRNSRKQVTSVEEPTNYLSPIMDPDSSDNPTLNPQCHQVQELEANLQQLELSLAHCQKERDYFKKEIQQMKKDKEVKENLLDKIKGSDDDISFYTGFPSYELFKICFDLVDPGENGENINYCHSANNPNASIRQRKLRIMDEFLLILIRLRLGTFEQQLAHMFDISISTVHRVCNSWINFLYLRFGSINIWPTDAIIKETMPASMKEKYPNLTWIIDAFEIQCARPSSLMLASQSYSNYKSRNTLKGLIACTPSGQIGFISQLYTGSISDRELTIRSGFLKLPHTKGSMWLVDKGFQIQDLCDFLGVKVNMPAFVGKNSQMSADEVFHTQQVASERIHVERAINKVKNFHIFDRPIPISILGSVNQMWSVCAFLTLMQNPIISA